MTNEMVFEFRDQFKRMDNRLQLSMNEAAQRLGLNVQNYCEMLAVAARLGEISLRSKYGPKRS